jgi:hypothetical protein
MNQKNEIFEPCDSNQTENQLKTESFEQCHNNQTKKGRGGARLNSGMKASGIETVTVRIDKRLLNTVTEIKTEFKDGKLSLDDITAKFTAKHDDSKLREEMAELELDRDNFRSLYFERRESSRDEIKQLKHEIAHLQEQLFLAQIDIDTVEKTNSKGLDEKLRKRLIHFCHPDKNPDREETANELTQALNNLNV